jgi:hypothetical protein
MVARATMAAAQKRIDQNGSRPETTGLVPMPVSRKPAEARSCGAQQRLGRLPSNRRSPVAARLAEMPPKCRLGYLLAIEGRAAPRAAIKSFCLECVGWQRSEVTLCTAVACPLWAYRPFRKG